MTRKIPRYVKSSLTSEKLLAEGCPLATFYEVIDGVCVRQVSVFLDGRQEKDELSRHPEWNGLAHVAEDPLNNWEGNPAYSEYVSQDQFEVEWRNANWRRI